MKNYYSISPIFNPGGIGSGFFSNYRICLEKLIDHHENNGEGIPYINWANTTFVDGFNPVFKNGQTTGEFMPNDDTNNPFNFWFDQDNPYELGVEKDNIIISPINRRNNSWIDHSNDYFNNPIELKRQQNIDKKYIKIKKFITDKIDEIYKRELEGHVVLGVMARGSEYNRWHGDIYGTLGINEYISKIKEILNLNLKISKILILSDETEYVHKIHETFPFSYFVPDVFRRTDESLEYINEVPYWMNVSDKRNDHCKLLGEETIIQTKLLSKCDYLVGRHCGVLAGAVLWNENIKQIFKI